MGRLHPEGLRLFGNVSILESVDIVIIDGSNEGHRCIVNALVQFYRYRWSLEGQPLLISRPSAADIVGDAAAMFPPFLAKTPIQLEGLAL